MTKLRNAVSYNFATNIKLSKPQISKLIQSGGLVGAFLKILANPILKIAIPLPKSIITIRFSISSFCSRCRNSKEKKDSR